MFNPQPLNQENQPNQSLKAVPVPWEDVWMGYIPTPEEKKAIVKEKRMKQRNLFESEDRKISGVTTPKGGLTGQAALDYLKEQGIEETNPADLLTNLPF